MKLQYDLKALNVTELVTKCRAGGKPSTWFPPGTRRAVNASDKFFYDFLPRELCDFKIAELTIVCWNFQEL